MTPRCAPPAPMTRRPPWRCAAQIPSCRRTPWSPPPRCSRPVRVERYPATDSANRVLESLESRTATADGSLTVDASPVLGAAFPEPKVRAQLACLRTGSPPKRGIADWFTDAFGVFFGQRIDANRGRSNTDDVEDFADPDNCF